MNALVRLHNLNTRLRPSTDDLFAGIFGHATVGEPRIKIDVAEDDKAYRVTAVLAGVQKRISTSMWKKMRFLLKPKSSGSH